MYFNQTQFKGKLDGMLLSDFKKLDYSIDNYEKRKEYIDGLLDDNNFFEEYFDNHYNPNINSKGYLSENSDVCSTLENMATYLLNSSDVIAEDKKKKYKYTIHKNKDRFIRNLNRENITVFNDQVGAATNLTEEENVIHFLVSSENTKKPKKQVVKKSDINKNTETGRVLREYNNLLIAIDDKLRGESDGRRFIYSRAKSKLKDDMIYVKNVLDGVWGYNINGQESVNPDYYIFDFTHHDTILELIKMQEPDIGTNLDLWLTWMEFNIILSELNLSKDEHVVLYMLRDQWSMADISRQTGIDYQRIQRTIVEDIILKISKKGNKYDASDIDIENKINNMITRNKTKNKIFAKGDA